MEEAECGCRRDGSSARARVRGCPAGDSQVLHPWDQQGRQPEQVQGPAGGGWSMRTFSHDSFCYVSAKGAPPRATKKDRGPWRFAEGGEGAKEPSYMEGEQGDQRNVAVLPNSMLADAFSQDGHNNISHPTSPSRTFHSPTKEWNLSPLLWNLGRLVTHSPAINAVEVTLPRS